MLFLLYRCVLIDALGCLQVLIKDRNPANTTIDLLLPLLEALAAGASDFPSAAVRCEESQVPRIRFSSGDQLSANWLQRGFAKVVVVQVQYNCNKRKVNNQKRNKTCQLKTLDDDFQSQGTVILSRAARSFDTYAIRRAG